MRRGLSLSGAAVALVGLALSLGACSSSSGDSSNSAQTTVETEVFTWWAEGSEKAGLDALIAVMKTQHPTVEFVNATVAGGAGSNAKDVLNDRLLANDPPDSFQAHAGAELTDYIKNGQVQDLSALYDEFGLRNAFPKDLIDRLTVKGRIYSIPANIHRANVVWANPAVLKDAGVDPKATYATIDDWIAALAKVKKSGKIPLSLGTTWTQVQLFEVVLLSELGAKDYSGLWDGSTDWAGSDVTKAITDFQTLVSYSNDDRDDLEWPAAALLVEKGEAAFNVMGDWAVAQFEADGKKYGTDFTSFPVPGTDGVFDFLADSFTLPVGAPHPEGAKAWLETIASPEGQLAFNKAKGSIPARTDADATQFSVYQQSAIKDFASDEIVSSLAHGAAASTTVSNKIGEAVADFVSGKTDSAKFQAALVASVA